MVHFRGFQLFLWASLVVCQTTHVVQVGQDGSFYDPATISAVSGDTVQFVFQGSAHTVVQSNFTHPCVPLPGGFSSGVAGTNTSGTATAPPVWNLVITDDTQPIWFYCAMTKPSSHCGTGMVGVINAPSIPAYQEFKASAKAISGTPKPTPSVALSGIGAIATKPPTVPPGPSITPDTNSTNSTSFSSAPSPSNTTSIDNNQLLPSSSNSSSKKIGAIVGGVIGGLVLVIGAIITATVCLSKRRRQVAASDGFFNYGHSGEQRATGLSDSINQSKYATTASLSSAGGAGILASGRRRSADLDDTHPVPDMYQAPSRRFVAEDSQSRGGNVARDMADFFASTRIVGHPYQNAESSVVHTPPPISPRPVPVFPYSTGYPNSENTQRTKEESLAYSSEINRDSLADRTDTESPAPPLYRSG